jgi:hypothetical protein
MQVDGGGSSPERGASDEAAVTPFVTETLNKQIIRC